MQKYKLADIFYSIQGEGHYTGMPAIFVRFAGCNLQCTFCDTDHTLKFEASTMEIVREVARYPAKQVVLTGGEPMLQPIKYLLWVLHKHGYWVALETNGTIPEIPTMLDWVTASPKRPTEFTAVCDEMKVVYMGQALTGYQPKPRNAQRGVIKSLQPCSMQNISETVKTVKENPEWRLSVQVHKLIGLQ